MELSHDRKPRAATATQFFPPPSGPPPSQIPPMFQSVVQRVCSIPELLDLIFDHLDSSSNVNNLVVCKAWSEVARDKLWWEVCNPRQLLSILAPISAAGVSTIVVVQTYTNNSLCSSVLREEVRAKGLVSVYAICSPHSQVRLRGSRQSTADLYRRSRGDIRNQDESQPSSTPSRIYIYHRLPHPEEIRGYVHERDSSSV